MYDFTDLNKYFKALVIFSCIIMFFVAFPISSAIYCWLTGYQYTPIVILGALFGAVELKAAGMAIVVAMLLIPITYIGMVKLLSPKAELFGSARMARSSELGRHKMYKNSPGAIVLGVYKNRKIFFNGDLHIFLSALTGSGKSTSFVIPNLLNWTESAIVLDIKRECFDATSKYRKDKLGNKIFLFDPTSQHTDGFNPFDFLSFGGESFIIKNIQSLAATLVPIDDQYWDTKARQLATGLILMLFEQADFLGLQKTIGQVFRLLGAPGGLKEQLEEYIGACETEGCPLSTECLVLLHGFCNEEDRPRGSIISSLNGHLELWLDPNIDRATAKSTFDLNTFRFDKQTLYLVSSPTDLKRLNSVFRMLVETFIACNTRSGEVFGATVGGRKIDTQVMIMLDEFVQLGKMEALVGSLAYARGFGIKVCSIIQSTNQLKSLYGDQNANVFEESHRCSLLYRPNRMSSHRINEMAEALGHITAKVRSRTRPMLGGMGNRTVNESLQQSFLVKPEEIRNMPDSRQFVLVDGMYPIYAHKLPYFKDRAYSRRAKMGACNLPGALTVPTNNILPSKKRESLLDKIKKIVIVQKNERFSEAELDEITKQFCELATKL